MQKAKECYYNEQLVAADNKRVFQIVNKLINDGTKVPPSCDSHKQLSDSFAGFFRNKIDKIRGNLGK